MNRDDFAFSHRLRVRWAEVDRQDVVFNANYFIYFDVAVTEYWRAAGVAYPHGYVDRYGQDIFAVQATARYHLPVTFEDELDIDCRVSKLGRSSLVFTLAIWKQQQHTTSGELVYVNTDLTSQRPAPWPDSLRRQVIAFERRLPAGC